MLTYCSTGAQTNLLGDFEVAFASPTDLFFDLSVDIAPTTEVLGREEGADAICLSREPREYLYALPAEGSNDVEGLDGKELAWPLASHDRASEESAALTSKMIALGFGRGAKRVPVCVHTSSSSEIRAFHAFLKPSSFDERAKNSALPIEMTLGRRLSRIMIDSAAVESRAYLMRSASSLSPDSKLRESSFTLRL